MHQMDQKGRGEGMPYGAELLGNIESAGALSKLVTLL